jgi:hypothetical protein
LAVTPNRQPKNGRLLRFPYPSLLRRTSNHASLLGILVALHLGIFEQPKNYIFQQLPNSHRLLDDKATDFIEKH